jgi:calmodulin/calcium-binding protein CML/plastin-2
MADSDYDGDKVDELRETFEYNDRDGDGMIQIDEFVTMLAELEAGVSAAEARLGFQDIDSNDDGLIDFKEFVSWWTED